MGFGIPGIPNPLKKAEKVVKNVAGAAGDVVGGATDVAKVVVGGVERIADDFLGIDDSGGIVGSVKEIGDKVWSGLTEVGDEIKKLSENPYVQLAVAVALPGYAPYINAAVKLNSGEKLNNADIAALALKAGNDLGEFELTPREQTRLQQTIRAAEDKDFNALAFQAFAESGIDLRSELADKINTAVGPELGQFYLNNAREFETAFDIFVGEKDPLDAIVDEYGQDIVNSTFSTDPTQQALGWAGLKTAVGLDQGLSANDALLAGAEEYITRGGGLPDFNEIASSVGIKDFDVDIPDLGLDIPELEGLGLNIREIADLGIDISGLGIEGLELRGFGLPEIQGLGVDISGLTFPELQARGYELANIGELGFSIPEMDLSGLSPRDLGYDVGSWGELQDLGVDIGSLDLSEYNLGQLADLNFDLQLPGVETALQKVGQGQQEYASLEPDEELMGDTFDFLIEPEDEDMPLSQRVLASV